jgi:uncharacterized membrane protein
MAFCPNCGTETQGRFCAKCGSPVTPGSQATPGSSDPGQTPHIVPPPVSAGSSGLTDNLAAALCYLLMVLTGVLFLVLEPYNRNKTIRFHAFQSIFLWIAVVVAYIAISILSLMLLPIPFAGAAIILLLHVGLSVGIFILWLMLMYKAYNNQRWELPVIGPMAAKQA